MIALQTFTGIPWGFICLLGVTVWMTVREPRRVSVAILWGLTVNSFIFMLVNALNGRLWEISEELSAWVLLGMLAGILVSVLVLASLLISEGIKLIRREAFSFAHSLSLILGLGILLYLAAIPVILAKDMVMPAVLLLTLGLPLGYLAFVLTSYLLYSWGYARWVCRYSKPPRAVVVLGAGLSGEELTPLLRARTDLGIESYRRAEAAGSSPVLIASGGQGPDEMIPEGTAIARYARKMGVANVLEETTSTTTEQNLLYSRDLAQDTLGWEVSPWLAVSSDYHAFRAAVLMREVGLAGNAIGARTPRYFWSSAVLREYVALLVRHWKLNAVVLTALAVPLLVMVVSLIRSALPGG